MSEQNPKPPRIEIDGADGLALRQLATEDAQGYFDLIEYNRAHLSRFDDVTSLNYSDVGSVVKSIVSPDNPSELRFGIWAGGIMVGSLNARKIASVINEELAKNER